MNTIHRLVITLTAAAGLVLAQAPREMRADDACTDIIVGKAASADGSVITSHTGCGPECRVHVVPGRTFKEGAKAAVYYGIQDVNKPIDDYGRVLGYIPQAERTFTYFHSAYSHINEHQLAIGESTLSQRPELEVDVDSGAQIMTIEQAQIFALQRCTTARDAVRLIGGLMTEYGFLPSCGPNSEALCIADPEEAWIFEVFSVGKEWDPESGRPGAIWAAQRVPDDHIAIVPNWSVIKEIDLSRPDWFMASDNYQQTAIEYGWWDPESGRPFVWQDVYSPVPREWATGRFWLFFSTYAPHVKEWPDRSHHNPYSGYDNYHQYVEDLSIYPFSVKPEKKLSVQDVIAFQRSVFKGTIYDMTEDYDWYVPAGEGKIRKSPLATPFPTRDMRELLDIPYRRMVSRGGYGMVAQLRSWLPDPIGGVYWLYLDNQHVSSYVPIYAGVQEIHPAYKEYDPGRFSPTSARWAIDFVDNLLYLKWQEAIRDVRAVRDPLEAAFFAEQSDTDSTALALYRKSPRRAKEYLTGYTRDAMEKSHRLFTELRAQLITDYTNNNQGL
ncbi:C69 family dipeptidase [bacterium]|nr:C69 family dipeptidase [bacterium]